MDNSPLPEQPPSSASSAPQATASPPLAAWMLRLRAGVTFLQRVSREVGGPPSLGPTRSIILITAFRRLIGRWTATQARQGAKPSRVAAPVPLLLEELEEIVLFNAVPDVTIVPPADDVFIGENFTFEVTFDNVGTTEGYGPIIDLIFPMNGADGRARRPTTASTLSGVRRISALLSRRFS